MKRGDMIYIYYTLISIKWPDELGRVLMKDFPEEEKRKIERVIPWMDKQSKIAGRKLLQHGLKEMNLDPENIILKYNPYQKPFLENGPFFNIAHSGAYVVCAISEEIEIGIDIEKKRRKKFPDIPLAFTDTENAMIDNCPDKLYDFWTKKEAIVKAEGRGLLHKLSTMETSEGITCLNGKQYTTMEIAIDPDYACHIAYHL
jgi:4'-phosphopantetheinyl transferase